MVAIQLLEKLGVQPDLKREEVIVLGLSDEPVKAWHEDEDAKRWPDWHPGMARRPLTNSHWRGQSFSTRDHSCGPVCGFGRPTVHQSLSVSGYFAAFVSVPIMALFFCG